MSISPKQSKVLAWIVVPVAFSVATKATYMVAESRFFPGFFPGELLWLIGIAVAVCVGLTFLLVARPRANPLVVVAYAPAMAAILFVLHALVACSSGSCF